MNREFLIPANTKRSKLIFGLFRTVDLIIFLTGVIISMILLITVPVDTISTMIITLLPGMVCGMLVLPVPYYHNVLVAILEIYSFYSGRQRFIWKGWCVNGKGNDK